jgi:hypothetical protein
MPGRHHRSRRSRRSPSTSTSYSSSSYSSPSPRRSSRRHRSKSKSRPQNKSKEDRWPLTPAFTIAATPLETTTPKVPTTPNFPIRDRYSTTPNAHYTTDARIEDGEILQTLRPNPGQITYNNRYVLPPDLTIPLPTTQRTFNIRWDDCIRHRGVVLPFGQYRDALLRYHNTMVDGPRPFPDLMEALKTKQKRITELAATTTIDNSTMPALELVPRTTPPTAETSATIAIAPDDNTPELPL